MMNRRIGWHQGGLVGGIAVVVAVVSAMAVGQVERRSAMLSDEFTADVKPSRSVVLSPQLPGRLRAVHVQVDQVVEEGDLLAELDDGMQVIVTEAARLRAEREDDIIAAQAFVGEAELEVERQRELIRRDASNPRELRRAELELVRAEAELASAKTEKELAEAQHRMELERLERHRIRAPFSGRILEVSAEPGATLSERDPVLTLIAVDTLDARFILLPKELHDQLEVGRAYRLQADAPVNEELVGTLKWIAPQIDYGSGSIRAEFSIDNSDHRLKPGFGVRLIWPQDEVAEGGGE